MNRRVLIIIVIIALVCLILFFHLRKKNISDDKIEVNFQQDIIDIRGEELEETSLEDIKSNIDPVTGKEVNPVTGEIIENY